jgi:hypothetical protein
MRTALCVLTAIPPTPQVHGAHLLAGLVATGLEHSRDGVGVADWAEFLLTRGLQGGQWRVGWAWIMPILVCYTIFKWRGPGHCGPLTRDGAAGWADAAVRCASTCSTWASSPVLILSVSGLVIGGVRSYVALELSAS